MVDSLGTIVTMVVEVPMGATGGDGGYFVPIFSPPGVF